MARVVVLCAVAEDAWDVLAVLRTFYRVGGLRASQAAQELLYLVCLGCLYMQRRSDGGRLPGRFHHVVAQALHMYESEWGREDEHDERHCGFAPTAEQARQGHWTKKGVL